MAVVNANDDYVISLGKENGGPVGYAVQEVQGVLQYFPAVAKGVSEQIHSGPYSLDALPAEVSSPLSFDSWAGGAGLEYWFGGTEENKGRRADTYSYSRGVDASYGDRLVMSPAKQTHTTPGTGVPSKFLYTNTWGLFRATGTDLTLYNETNDEWDAVETFASAITDMVEYGNSTDNYLVVAIGDSGFVQYSTDGTTFSAGDAKGSYLTVGGALSTEPVLWMINTAGAIRSSTAPALFSNADYIGSASDLVVGLTTLAEMKMILKTNGVYAFDGVNVRSIIASPEFIRSTNCVAHCIFMNKLYFNFLGKVLEYDIAQDALRVVYATQHPELNGTIKALTSDARFIYMSLYNDAGNSYICKLVPHAPRVNQLDPFAFHTIAYVSGVAVPTMALLGPGVLKNAQSNPVLEIATATEGYYIMARDGLSPADDDNYIYETSGILYGSHHDANVLTFSKLLHGIRAYMLATLPTSRASVDYQTDADGVYHEALDIDEEGSADVRIDEDTPYTTVQYRVTLTGTAGDSPTIMGILLDSTPNPPRRRIWGMVLELGPKGGTPRETVEYREEFLMNLPGTRADFVDFRGNQYTVLVLDVKGQGYTTYSAGPQRTAVALYAVTLVEV
jgi:hypothetical protein